MKAKLESIIVSAQRDLIFHIEVQLKRWVGGGLFLSQSVADSVEFSASCNSLHSTRTMIMKNSP